MRFKILSNVDKVIAELKYLDLHLNISENYWDRFLTQKTVFLAQTLGIKTSYPFTIYVAGPYSKKLADDYYECSEEIKSYKTPYILNDDDCIILEKIKNCPNLLTDMFLLEATSTSLLFMIDSFSHKDYDVFSKIKSIKNHLPEKTIAISISRAKELLFKSEYLTNELKHEFDLWDKIGG